MNDNVGNRQYYVAFDQRTLPGWNDENDAKGSIINRFSGSQYQRKIAVRKNVLNKGFVKHLKVNLLLKNKWANFAENVSFAIKSFTKEAGIWRFMDHN